MMVNHAKSVGRNNLYPYTVGAIIGVLKGCPSPDETVSSIGEIIKAMHEVVGDESLPLDVEKAPVTAGAGEENREEFIPINFITKSEVVTSG